MVKEQYAIISFKKVGKVVAASYNYKGIEYKDDAIIMIYHLEKELRLLKEHLESDKSFKSDVTIEKT